MSTSQGSAFRYDDSGAYAIQDPDEDLDWTFDFNDGRKPCLETGETITTIVEFNLTRGDGSAITTEVLHDIVLINTSTAVLGFVKLLKRNKDYVVEATVQTSNSPPRRYSRSFRLLCRER